MNWNHRSRPLLTARVVGALLAAVSLSAGSASAQLEMVEAFQTAVQTAIRKVEGSVVAIARVRKGAGLAPSDPDFIPSEYATGVVISRRGMVLTNYHVLGNPDENDYWVWTRGTPYRVLKVERPRAADPWLDLAVLSVGADDLQPIKWGDASALRKGSFVIGLGNPYAIARDGEVSASLGMVSNLGRKAPPLPNQQGRETLHQLGTLIQTNLRLPLGCSGGALVNLDGEMVGMTVSLVAMAGEESEGGFAIPVDETFRRAVAKLKAGQVGEYGYLGVRPVTTTLAERREGLRGAVVQNVSPATPAAAARLRRQDLIIAVNSQPVRHPNDLVRLVSSQLAGDEIQITLLRGEEDPVRLQRSVRLSKKRVSGSRPAITSSPPRRWRGAEVEYVTAMPNYPFHSYKVDPQGCVGLLEVAADSPLWRAGYRPGDYVSHIAGRRVTTPDEFFSAVAGLRGTVTLRRPAAQGEPAKEVNVEP